MNFFKRSAWNLAYKSVFYTVRDHADKLEAHFANGGNLNESAGAFGTAEQYAQKLSVELDKIREMATSFAFLSLYKLFHLWIALFGESVGAPSVNSNTRGIQSPLTSASVRIVVVSRVAIR